MSSYFLVLSQTLCSWSLWSSGDYQSATPQGISNCKFYLIYAEDFGSFHLHSTVKDYLLEYFVVVLSNYDVLVYHIIWYQDFK